MKQIAIGIVGDYTENKHTHHALNECIKHVQKLIETPVHAQWIGTDELEKIDRTSFHGWWIAPGSPYKNDDAVYRFIQWTRNNDQPTLGTCGGFQYMVVEYAKHVLNIAQAGHEESDPKLSELVISRLSCSLKGQFEDVVITDKDSWLFEVFKTEKFTAGYNCNYGVNEAYTEQLERYPFVFTARSPEGMPRALELKGHRFFKGTLFQPPLTSTYDKPDPLIRNFILQCVPVTA